MKRRALVHVGGYGPGTAARTRVARPGVDVATKLDDIRRIVLKHCVRPGIDPADLVQETLLGILRKNGTPSAFDPALSAFSHYVVMQGNNARGHMLEKLVRHRRAVAVGDDLPEVPDDRDPVGAWFDAEDARAMGITAEGLEAQLDRVAEREALAASTPRPVQLTLSWAV